MCTKLIFATALAAVFSTTVQAEPFFAQMVLQGVTFQVESPNDSSLNNHQLKLVGSNNGLKVRIRVA